MTPLSDILQAIQDYLSGKVEGDSIVYLIDDAVSSDAVYQYPEVEQEIILRYQNVLALFVRDDNKRRESTLYYGPDQLREILFNLYRELKRLSLK